MKIIFLDWNSYGNDDLIEAMEKMNIEVVRYAFNGNSPRRDPELESKLLNDFEECKADAVLSFNYFPIVSTVANRLSLKYISWVYDSPHVTLYSYTIIQPCNVVFLFDRAEYLKFHNQGINTVHYLPLAANPDRISKTIESTKNAFRTDISFIGSLYSEKYDFLNNLKPSPDGIETVEWLKTEYVDNRYATSEDRITLLNEAANHATTHLFTGSDTSSMDSRINLNGKVDYYTEAPIIYRNSKINLCMTLRSIHSGIPLRVFDIMASQGALFMNHQSDMDDFFVPGEDYYIYNNFEDYKKKLDLMLNSDTSGMVKSAFDKIKEAHTYDCRLKEIVKFI